jgi:hypothetical protein
MGTNNMTGPNNVPEAGGIATEGTGDGKSSQAPRTVRGGKGRSQRNGAAEAERFFLGKSASNGGLPVLGHEVKTEAEAIGESFKTGVPYFVVSERRGVAEFADKTAHLRGEPVRVPQKGE